MRGKKHYKEHVVLPDPRYNNEDAAKFVNMLMWEGKKSVAYKIFYDALDIVSEKTQRKGIDVWNLALENVYPTVETKNRRIGGVAVKIPVEIYPKRSKFLAMTWIINFARERSEKRMCDKLAAEIISAYNNEGKAVKRKEDTHRMAASNNAAASLKF